MAKDKEKKDKDKKDKKKKKDKKNGDSSADDLGPLPIAGATAGGGNGGSSSGSESDDELLDTLGSSMDFRGGGGGGGSDLGGGKMDTERGNQIISLANMLKELDVAAEEEEKLRGGGGGAADAAAATAAEPPKQIKRKRRQTIRRMKYRIKELFGQNGAHPLVIFINPKSGGNQGVKLFEEFKTYLNVDQVQDLSAGGPKAGLEMFKHATNWQILVCGGDGTAGWVLSALDGMNISPAPPMAVLPLGTGNDLARVLKWGGGYEGEPVLKVFSWLENSTVCHLDRWSLHADPIGDCPDGSSPAPPYNVVNNYFSYGVDAWGALQFHLKREKHPERFNSRITNKLYYGMVGGMDMVKHACKNLARDMHLECDGKDMTQVLVDNKVEGVIFLNIQSHAGGTFPWGWRTSSKESYQPPAMDDGLIEVVGIGGAMALAKMQARVGSGIRVCQCRTAKITTNKSIAVQVDGEPCMLQPCVITLTHKNRVPMLGRFKDKKGGKKGAGGGAGGAGGGGDDDSVGDASPDMRRKPGGGGGFVPSDEVSTSMPELPSRLGNNGAHSPAAASAASGLGSESGPGSESGAGSVGVAKLEEETKGKVRVAKRDSETLDRFVMAKANLGRTNSDSSPSLLETGEMRRRSDSTPGGADGGAGAGAGGGRGGSGAADASEGGNAVVANVTSDGKPRRRYTDSRETPV